MFGGSRPGRWRQCNAVTPAVTATQAGAGTHNGMALSVTVVNNANITVTGPQYQSYFYCGTAGAANANAPAEVTITPKYTGSWVYGAVNRNNASTSWTPDAWSLFSQNVSDAVNTAAYGTFMLASAPTALTVTATQGGTTHNGMALRVMVLTGAAAVQNGATAAVDAFFATAFTTTVTGSRVYGAAVSPDFGSPAGPVTGATTVMNSVHDPVNSMYYYTFKTGSLTGTPGSIYGGVGIASSGAGGCAAVEIVPAGALTEDASSPPVASTTAATSVVTASFSPPTGSLLVAMVASDGGVSQTTMTVSGGGLIWSEQAHTNAGGHDYAGVWTAVVPASSTDTTTAGVPVTTGASNGDGASGAYGGVAVCEIPPAPGQALAQDPSTPAAVTVTGATSVSTVNFQPPMGALLVATVACAGGAAVTVADDNGALAWVEQAGWASGTSGYAGVWTAVVVCG